MALDLDACYTVKGWAGIAFYIHGFPKRWEPEMAPWPYDDDYATGEYDTGDGEWVAQDETCGRVNVVMVGDDRKWEVDVSDLTLLPEGGYCGSCGQIRCGHGNL